MLLKRHTTDTVALFIIYIIILPYLSINIAIKIFILDILSTFGL